MPIKTITSIQGLKFALLDSIMVEAESSDVAFVQPYITSRRAIHDVFQRGVTEVPYLFLNLMSFTSNNLTASIYAPSKDHLEFGCQTFKGRNLKTLKSWAKGYNRGRR